MNTGKKKARGERPRRGSGLRIQSLSWAPLSVWVIAVAVLAAIAYVAPAIERSVVSDPLPETVTVGTRQADMRQAVRAEYTLRPPAVVLSPAAGTVTGLLVQSGTALNSGTPVLQVDGVVINAYRETVPLYRPLSYGSRGADVASLASFLIAAGVLDPAASSDFYGRQISNAVTAYQKRVGIVPDGTFLPAYVVFVPADFDTVASIKPKVGDIIEAGDLVATGQAQLEHVTFEPASEGVPLGDFGDEPVTFTVGDVALSLTSVNLTPDDLRSLATFIPSASGDAGPGASTVEGILALGSPHQFGVVPSSAVYLASDGSACLFSINGGKEATAVQAVGTDVADVAFGELGVIYVDFDLGGLRVFRDPSVLSEKELDRCG